MRRLQRLAGAAVLSVVGCSSQGSGSLQDAGTPLHDGAHDSPAIADLGPDSVAVSDSRASSDQAPAPDSKGRTDVASPGADAGPDTGAGPGADSAPSPDAPAARQDTAPAPDSSVRADAGQAADRSPGPEVGSSDAAFDAAATEAGPDLPPTTGRVLGGCQILPSNHIFNTAIDSLPVHPNSAAFMSTIGNHNIHLDLGTSTDMTSSEYYGIPYNVVAGNTLAWVPVSYSSTDSSMSWDPLSESDCVDKSSGAAHTVVSPCLASKAPKPWLPIPAAPLVEGGIDTDPSQPYGDHHMLIIDSDACRLWELYHCYPDPSSGWDIFGSATFDLNSNALRPADWTSADAAGFPILPLLILASEASSGEIRHALRFTINSSSIRNEYVWPARHLTTNGTTASNLPPMGQLFRLKASYQIPSSFGSQSRAILQALKTYGMYIADGGSNMYIQGDPSADWQDSTFSQVQSVGSSQFEAVDTSPIMNRTGFDPNSAAVPPP